jgi:hypothetical protein
MELRDVENLLNDNDEHPWKQNSWIEVTEFGIVIDEREEHSREQTIS